MLRNVKYTLPFFITIFISTVIIFGIMEFRFAKNILANYESSLQRVAVRKTELFLTNIQAVSENAAKLVQIQGNNDLADTLNEVADLDPGILNVSVIDNNGKEIKSLRGLQQNQYTASFIKDRLKQPTNQRIALSGVHAIPHSVPRVYSLVRLSGTNQFLLLDFRTDQFAKEIKQEFQDELFRIAVFDGSHNAAVWPFAENPTAFQANHQEFYASQSGYDVIAGKTDQQGWQVYLFLKKSNFETIRAITVLLLVFVLYICLYQLLVEYWGINTAKTYFENIDFAILNQVNEGVILSNNAGQIIFANQAAYKIFAERKKKIKNAKLTEVLGHIENKPNQANTLTLKVSDKLLEVIHSPIIKKNKKLGSLSVISPNTKEQQTLKNVLDKLIEMSPEGIIYVDKNHEITAFNLMAKYYLGNLDIGTSINLVDPDLAASIYRHIGSRNIIRSKLSVSDVLCEVAPVYDADGVYMGTLVVLLNSEASVGAE